MMVRTMLRIPTPPPPPPPPPPPSGIQVKSKNGSSSGGTKWTLRTEARDGGNKNSMTSKAEGVIEIPKPQSVASLREQIARKLEVKMPSIPPLSSGSSMTIANGRAKSPLWISSSNEQYPYVPQHDDASKLRHVEPKMSKPSSNSQSLNHTTLQKQLSVVHEPMERHISCITPVPFNRTATLSSSVIISPNILNIYSNNISVVPTSSSSATFSLPSIIHKHKVNSDHTCSPASDMAGSDQLNDYQKLKPVKEKVDDHPQPSLSSTTSSIANGTIGFHHSTISENTATPLLTLNPPSFFVNGQNTDRNETAFRILGIPASVNHDDIVPTSNHSTDIAQEVGSQFGASSSSIVTTSTPACEMLPLWKPMELRTKMQSIGGHLHQFQSENLTANAILKKCNSHHSAPKREFHGTTDTIPDDHTENSSWYRTMFKKMHVVDQLGKLFYDYFYLNED
ncbi:unnamed protein product [Cercopithifilaria johnstoni]|uniref:Uncharacterized protein n=1 Tax=Cercopithifilaria johnstoni TaxID=2874296 RepID=A0A8J2MKW4_9BILA|nr:unnamed protein product [Cercopithifilaria johnstoni]